jgi:hypothetical protein
MAEANKPLEEGLRVVALGISEKCYRGCDHCALDLNAKGYQMKFRDFERIVSGDIKFDSNRLIATYAEPFYYFDRAPNGDKDYSDVVSAVLRQGVDSVFIWTSGFSSGHSVPLKAVKGLSKNSGSVEIGLSFNLFQGDKEKYFAHLEHTVQSLSFAQLFISTVNVTYSCENKMETEAQLGRLMKILGKHYGSRAQFISILNSAITNIGRAKNITKFGVLCESPACSMRPRGESNWSLVLRANGDLSPCFSGPGFYTPPVANALKDSWSETIGKYRDYLLRFELHMAKKPASVSRCAWHKELRPV